MGPVTIASRSAYDMDEEATSTRELQEGTFVLQMTDQGSGKQVWQGRIAKLVDMDGMWDADSPQRRAERTAKARRLVARSVRRLLKDFPPRVTSRTARDTSSTPPPSRRP